MLSTKRSKTLEPSGFLRYLALSVPRCAQMVTHSSSAQMPTARHSHTATRCAGHSSRYQRLNGSQGSMGLGCLYTVVLPCCAAAVTCCGQPYWIRTSGLQLRRLLLYPAELRAAAVNQSQCVTGCLVGPPGVEPGTNGL